MTDIQQLAADLGNAVGHILSVEMENKRLREALTPSAETKAAYIGEFSYLAEQIDEHDEQQTNTYFVPWTTIKEIMAAILERASGSESSPGETKPTPETGPPLPDALPECLFRFCPTEDKCKANGCATPRTSD